MDRWLGADRSRPSGAGSGSTWTGSSVGSTSGPWCDRIDLDATPPRHIDGIVARIDVGAVVRRVDVNAIMADVDVEELVGNTEIGSLLAKSTSSWRRPRSTACGARVVSLDAFVGRWVNRLIRRDRPAFQPGPPLLLARAPKALPAGSSAAEPG